MTLKSIRFSRNLIGVLIGALALTLSLGGVTFAETTWPSGPLNVIMHTKPGGTSDIFIRTLAKPLEPQIGQSVVVLNAPGGGGANQMSRIIKAKPDGLTLGINTLTHFTGMLTNLKGTFSPDDFSWIASVQEDPIIYFVRADSDINSLSDLIEKTRKNPNTVNMGGFGPVGSMQNLGTSMLETAADIKFNWVGFSSTPDIMTALLGGHVDVGITNGGPLKPFVESGRVKCIAVLGDKRLAPPLDKIKTFGEQGVEVDTSWVQVRGVYGPKGIPMELQQQIADAFHEAMKSESYQKYRESTGVTDSWMGPKEYTAFVKNISTTAEKQLKAAGIMK